MGDCLPSRSRSALCCWFAARTHLWFERLLIWSCGRRFTFSLRAPVSFRWLGCSPSVRKALATLRDKKVCQLISWHARRETLSLAHSPLLYSFMQARRQQCN